ncbi:hypothetical protein [Paenibacillus illinoisensis]
MLQGSPPSLYFLKKTLIQLLVIANRQLYVTPDKLPALYVFGQDPN